MATSVTEKLMNKDVKLEFAHLDDRVPSCQRLHCTPAALRLVVGSVVRLGLHFDLQAVRPRGGRELPVQSRQRRAENKSNMSGSSFV